jgi:hypothetical protein
VLAQRLTFLTDIAFARRMEHGMAIEPQIMERYLQELGRFLVEAAEAAREVAPQMTAEAAAYEAACSQAAIDALRHALYLRDREPARQPLRDVANRLGLTLDEADTDWPRLAYRALRIMLDAKEENARRDAGVYDAPSPFFRSERAGHAADRAQPAQAMVSRPVIPISCSAPPLSAETQRAAQGAATPCVHETAGAAPIPAEQAAQAQETPDPGHTNDAKAAPQTVNTKPAAGSMLLEDYFDLYIAKKIEGFTDDFGEEEVPDEAAGEKWRKSSQNNLEVGKRLWVGLLGNRPIAEIPVQEIRDAKKKMRRIPETHAKSCSETRNLDDLIRQTDAEENRNIQNAVAAALRAGGSEAVIERARLDNLIPRIRVETVLKHTRALNRPAKMLVKLGELEVSPFTKHMISNKSAENMRKSEEKRDRRPWDDRFYKFLATPVFRGHTEEVGDPFFWAPLMALLGGGREEEILQLSPDDFETTEGIHYHRLRNMPGNNIKSEAGHRVIPVHPELVRLGLIELVELRRRQDEPRLFPHLKRGKHKETFTELFTKDFTKYRQAHGVYWRGLDFHALRTTFHHRLMDNLVPGYVKRALMGHRKLDEGEKSYSQGGISMKTLHDVVASIRYDLSRVQSPFSHRNTDRSEAHLRVVS